MAKRKSTGGVGREAPLKCRRCAQLKLIQVKALHGPSGDNCYDSARCPSLRHYLRNREAINRKRRMRGERPIEALIVDAAPLTKQYFAVLIRYQKLPQTAPLHAIEVQVWQGMELCAAVEHEVELSTGQIVRYPALHCLGLTASQIYTYVAHILRQLEGRYGIKKFDAEERRDPMFCPIRPCPHNPEP